MGERQPGRPASEGTAGGEVTLIDFGEEVPQGSPSPVGELTAPSLAKLAMEAFSLLDKTPPQSPTRALPRPLHPTPVVDWDARPLPPPPAYDDVAQDEDDFEVCSITSPPSRRGKTNYGFVDEGERGPVLEDNLFLPPKEPKQPSLTQTTELFEELQQECMKRLNVPLGLAAPADDKPQIPPRVPIPPRPLRRNEPGRWSGDLSPASGGEEDRPPQIPPRDPLSQPTSRTPSPMALQVGSPQQRATLCSCLSTSPGKPMPTTQSFALDPKYATPKVIQAQGKDCSKGPCILPIVKDGQKVSSTHYYLLPERPAYLDKYEKFFKEAKSPEEVPASRLVTTATVRPMVQQPPPDCKANFSSNNSNPGPKCLVKASCSLQKIIYDGPDAYRPADKIRLVSGIPGTCGQEGMRWPGACLGKSHPHPVPRFPHLQPSRGGYKGFPDMLWGRSVIATPKWGPQALLTQISPTQGSGRGRKVAVTVVPFGLSGLGPWCLHSRPGGAGVPGDGPSSGLTVFPGGRAGGSPSGPLLQPWAPCCPGGGGGC